MEGARTCVGQKVDGQTCSISNAVGLRGFRASVREYGTERRNLRLCSLPAKRGSAWLRKCDFQLNEYDLSMYFTHSAKVLTPTTNQTATQSGVHWIVGFDGLSITAISSY